MKKIYFTLILLISCISAFAQTDSISVDSVDRVPDVILNEVSITGIYRNNVTVGSLIPTPKLQEINVGQAPDYVFSTLPNIYAYNDNGAQMGYCYLKMRGMGMERINVTLDGLPWAESEDFGVYFSNAPDLMSSMNSIKVEKGASVRNNGTAAYAGNISLESVDLHNSDSHVDIGAGSLNSFRTSAVYNMGIHKGWGLHVRATQQQTDGYREHSQNNAQSLAFKVGYFFNEKHSIDLFSMTGFHRNGQGYQGIPMEMIDKTPTPFKQAKSGNREQETDNFLTTFNRIQYNGTINSKLFLTSSLYWQHQNGDYRIGWDDESAPTGKVLNNYHLNYNLAGLNTTVKYYALDNLSVAGGVNAYYYKRSHQGYDIANTDSVINIWHANGAEPYYDNYGVKPDVNVFGTVKWSPIHGLNLDANVQYRYTALHYRVNKAGDVADNDFNHTWNFVNYGFGISYDLNNKSQVYARYAVTNREPSRTDLFCGEYRAADSEMNTQNERVHDVEVGYEIKSKLISLNLNSFYMNFSNELVATGELSPTNFLPLHKQHDAYRTGIELATDINPVSTFHIVTNAAWSKNKIKNVGDDNKTMNTTFSPEWTCFAELNYEISRVKFGVNMNYRSDVYLDIYNQHTLKNNLTFNAYANVKVSKMCDVGVTLRNLINRLNFSNGSVGGDTAYYIVDSPFNFFVNAKFHF